MTNFYCRPYLPLEEYVRTALSRGVRFQCIASRIKVLNRTRGYGCIGVNDSGGLSTSSEGIKKKNPDNASILNRGRSFHAFRSAKKFIGPFFASKRLCLYKVRPSYADDNAVVHDFSTDYLRSRVQGLRLLSFFLSEIFDRVRFEQFDCDACPLSD